MLICLCRIRTVFIFAAFCHFHVHQILTSMLPTRLNLPTSSKKITIDLPTIELNEDILQYIREYDFSKIPVHQFHQIQSIPNQQKFSPNNVHIDTIINDLFSATLAECKIQTTFKPHFTPTSRRMSETNQTIMNSSPISLVKSRKRQKFLDVLVPKSPKSPNPLWGELELDEISLKCQEMIHSHADVNLLLDGLLRLFGNTNCTWFYELQVKLPLFIYQQLLPLDNEILPILLLHYPDQLDDTIHDIINHTNDPFLQFSMLHYCLSINNNKSPIIINCLLSNIIQYKSTLITICQQSIKHIYAHHFPMSHVLLKHLLNALYLFALTMTKQQTATWLDIIHTILSTPFPTPDDTPLTSLPTWQHILPPTTDNMAIPIHLLVKDALYPSYKCLLKSLLQLKEVAKFKLKTIKSICLLLPHLPSHLHPKLQSYIQTLLHDPSPNIREVALTQLINTNMPFEEHVQCMSFINDPSPKVAKSAIHYILHQFTNNKPHYIHLAFLLKHISNPELQPLLIKSLKQLLTSHPNIHKSILQCTLDQQQSLYDHAMLLYYAVVYLKSQTPLHVLYAKTTTALNAYFQLILDLMILKQHYKYCLLLTRIHYQWSIHYMDHYIQQLSMDINPTVLECLQCLIALTQHIPPTPEQQTPLILHIIHYITHGNAVAVEYAMLLLHQLSAVLKDMTLARIQGVLLQMITPAVSELTNRQYLVLGLIMKYPSLHFIYSNNNPMAVLQRVLDTCTSAIKFKCILDCCIGTPCLLLSIKDVVQEYCLLNRQHGQMMLQCFKTFISSPDQNGLNMMGEDVGLNHDVVAGIHMYLDIIYDIIVTFNDEALHELGMDCLYVILNESLVHPLLTMPLYYWFLMHDTTLFKQHLVFDIMLNKYQHMLVMGLNKVVPKSGDGLMAVYDRLTRKHQKTWMGIWIDKIKDEEMDGYVWMEMVLYSRREQGDVGESTLEKVKNELMVKESNKVNCVMFVMQQKQQGMHLLKEWGMEWEEKLKDYMQEQEQHWIGKKRKRSLSSGVAEE